MTPVTSTAPRAYEQLVKKLGARRDPVTTALAVDVPMKLAGLAGTDGGASARAVMGLVATGWPKEPGHESLLGVAGGSAGNLGALSVPP